MFAVFVGSSIEGRPVAERVAELLRTHPLLDVYPWWKTGVFRAGLSYYEGILSALDFADFGVFVATGDDLTVKRGRTLMSVRDNVLFEYALFAGRLGRQSALLLQVGDADLPSELEGISHVRVGPVDVKKLRRSRQLRNAVDRSVEQLLLASVDELSTTMEELRQGFRSLPLDHVNELLSMAMDERLRVGPPSFGRAALESILLRYTDQLGVTLGESAHQSTVSDYVDFSRMNPADLGELAAAYSHFVASNLSGGPTAGGVTRGPDVSKCSTRIAFHYKVDAKRRYERDMRFVAEVSRRLAIRPAMIDLSALPEGRVKGRCLRGERAVLVHDITNTATRPIECIQELRRRNVEVSRLVTFMVREDHLEAAREHCQANKVEFVPFCVRSRSGELRMAATR